MSNTIVSLVNSLLSKLLIDSEVLHVSGERFDLASSGGRWESEDTFLSVLGGVLELLSGRVVDFTLLWLILTSWEEDKLLLVLGKSLNVSVH